MKKSRFVEVGEILLPQCLRYDLASKAALGGREFEATMHLDDPVAEEPPTVGVASH